jgi:hypothetical protein
MFTHNVGHTANQRQSSAGDGGAEDEVYPAEIGEGHQASLPADREQPAAAPLAQAHHQQRRHQHRHQGRQDVDGLQRPRGAEEDALAVRQWRPEKDRRSTRV